MSTTPLDADRASRSRRPQKTSGDDRERAILVAFEELLERRGFHELAVDEIARGAGISRSTFYFYFASKDAVLLSLFERILDEARETRGDALERLAEDPAARLRDSLAAYMEAFSAHRAVTLAGFDAQATSPDLRALWSAAMEVWVSETTGAIEAERARGAGIDGLPARELAIALIRMNERVHSTSLAGLQPAVAADQVVDVLTGIWLAAIYGTTTPAGSATGG